MSYDVKERRLYDVKVITFAAQKGGCGKSSLAISCAVLAAQNSKRVLLLDADPQGTVLGWHSKRNGSPPVVRGLHFGRMEIEQTFKALSSKQFDFIFLDTPGYLDSNLSAALRESTFTLVPSRPTTADVHAMPVIAKMLAAAKRPFAFVLTQVSVRGPRADETAAALAELGDVAPVRITQRIAWQDAFTASQGVSEFKPGGNATRELAALWRWLNARIKGLD